MRRGTGWPARADFRIADWTERIGGKFGLVVANPPYIAEADLAQLDHDVRDWEPRLALTPGPTGLEGYRKIAGGLASVLASGGRALFELGAGQGAAVAEIFRGAGFDRAALHRDLDGRDRVLELRAPQ